MVDLASGQVSHGHVDGLFRLSYPPLPVKEGFPPYGIGVSTLITVSTLHVVPSYTQDMYTVVGWRHKGSLSRSVVFPIG